MKTSKNSLSGLTLCLAASGLLLPCSITAAEQSQLPKINIASGPISRETKAATSFAPIVKKVASNVVNIYSTKTVKEEMRSPLFNDPFFRRFFDLENDSSSPSRPRRQQGLGSGVIVSADGYILTSSHVIEGAEDVRVSLSNGTEYTAKVIGTDPPTDVAVLKVEATQLPAITLSDSSVLEVGDLVLAVGNPFGVGQTVTMGIVSAVGRAGFGIVDYEDFIQTDASINPGNSGGALTDAEGRLVGINTAIISRTGGNQGIGFSVPSNMARFIMEQIIKEGRVVRGYLGIYIQPLTLDLAKAFELKESTGALVGGVTPRSPAAKAGLKEGDVIVEFNGQKVTDSRQLRLTVAQTSPDTKASLKILREGKERDVSVTLGELPTQEMARGKSGSEGETGRAASGFLEGVELDNVTNQARRRLNIPNEVNGALVTNVDPGSTVYEAGLRPGDVIQEVNRQPVNNVEDLVRATRKKAEGAILLRAWSGGTSRYLIVDAPKAKK